MAWSRLRALFVRLLRRRASEQALDRELQSYLEHDAAARIRAGLLPADARRAALVEFGGVELVKEQVRDARSGTSFEDLWRDVRYAARALRRAPGFSLSVIASLAVGIGSTIAAFGFMNTLVFPSPAGVAKPDELVGVTFEHRCGRSWCDTTSIDESRLIVQSLEGLPGAASELRAQVTIATPEVRSVSAALVSDNYFESLGVRMARGRTFAAGQGREAPDVAVISFNLWTRSFNADPAVIGHTIRVASETVRIVGVAPRFFGGLRSRSGEIWLPLSLADRVAGSRMLDGGPPSAGEWRIDYFGRLHRNGDLDRVRAQAGVLATQLRASRQSRLDGRAEVAPLRESDVLKTSTMFLAFMAIPCLVLVIGCINAASLLLAHATHRGHEIAVRLAIGASRARVVRQLLLESLLLSLAAAAAALPAGWWGLRYAEGVFGVPLPLDGSVLAAALVAALVSAVGAGLAPALCVSAHRPARALGAVHGADVSRRQTWLRRALVALQVAISIGVLASGAQLVSAFEGLYEKERVDPDRLVMASFDLRQLNFSESEARAFYRKLIDRARRVPEIEAAGVAGLTAFWAFNGNQAPGGRVTVWRPDSNPGIRQSYLGGYAGGDMLRAVGLRMLQGRDFAADDAAAPKPLVAIVSRPLAEELFGPSALGQIVHVAASRSGEATPLEVRIVGIVEALWDRGFSTKPTPSLFLPVPPQHEPALTLYARSRVPIGALGPIVRDAVRQIDPRVPIVEFMTLRQRSERGTPESQLARAVAGLGVVASALAAFGLYALFSFMVTMRARELAVRVALGAGAGRMLRLLVVQAMALAAVGAAIGSPATFIVAYYINAEFHGMQGIDTAKLAGTIGLFAATMLVASLAPAIRAARVDPLPVLKQG